MNFYLKYSSYSELMSCMFTLLFIFWTSDAYVANCPFEARDKCDCSFIDQDLAMVCRSVSGTEEFRKLLGKARNFYGVQTHYIYIYDSNIGYFQPENFRGLLLKKLSFSNTHLTFYTKTGANIPFVSGEDSLEEIRLYNCSLTLPEPRWVLPSLTSLVKFTAAFNVLVEIPEIFFRNASVNLKELYLYNNHILSLGHAVFAKMSRLQRLILNNNNLVLFERSCLPRPAAELEEIHLKGNKLRFLPNDIFTEMPNLKLINMADNHLVRLTETTWQPIWSTLLDVYLQGNPFICDCDVRWLVQEEYAMAKVFKVDRYLYGKCFTPSYLKDKRLEDLKLTDIECKQ